MLRVSGLNFAQCSELGELEIRIQFAIDARQKVQIESRCSERRADRHTLSAADPPACRDPVPSSSRSSARRIARTSLRKLRSQG